RVVIARIPPRREMESRQVGLDLVPRDVEERPCQVPVTTSHRTQPSRAAASKQMEQEGLDLVILRVAQRDGGAVGLAGGLAQERVAGGAGRALRMWRAASGAGSLKLVAPLGRHRRHEVAIVLAIRTPGVVEMGHGEVQ